MTASMAKLLVLGLILCATCAHATELVVQKWVSVTRSLSGQVAILGTDEQASGVTVELCSPGWKKVIGSTKTENKGHFSFEQVAKSKQFYLRVSAPGTDIYQLRVHIDKHAGQELNIHLSLAT